MTATRLRRVALFLGILFTVHGPRSTAEADELWVGTAKLDLTPPVRTPLAGYSRRKGTLATGMHDPLFVRALAVQDGKTTVGLASCDLLIIDERLFDAVQQRLEAAAPRLFAGLLIAATHTHSGPGAYGHRFLEKLSMGHVDERVFVFLAERITQAILEAATHLRPTTVLSATVSTSGLVVNRADPEGLVDPDLSILIFADPTSLAPQAVAASFGAHPTTLGSWNLSLSADYPGVLSRIVEEREPSVPCLFFAGAVADQAPVTQGAGFERTEWLGRELASRIIGVLAQPPPRGERSQEDRDGRAQPTRLIMERRTVRLPPARLRIGDVRLPSWLSQPFVDDDATLTLVALDRLLIMGVPCDLSVDLGLELKAYARGRGYGSLLVGFANDYIGYCLPERSYWTDSYEASMAFNGPTTGPMLIDALKRMIDGLSD